MDKLIVNFTPTGMIPSKEITAFVPVSVSEIIEEVHQAFELGITMVHLHARDEEGVPTYKSDIYGNILEGLDRYCPELVTCLSLSGRNFNEFEKRSECLELFPDMGSLTLSSLNFYRQASVNSPDMIQKLAKKMNENGVKPELEIFDLGMINYAKYLTKKKILNAPHYFNIILGNIAGAQVDFSQIGSLINEIPNGSYWSLGGIGQAQLKANTLAIAMEGGVRVGLEDNIYFDSTKSKKATNIELITRIHHIAEIFGRNIMPSKEFGELGFYNRQKRS